MADVSADSDAQVELERLNDVIDKYTCQVEHIDNLLQELEEENNSDSVSRQIAEYQSALESHPENIPAEDALEVITRLENTLKIVQRRNHLLEKENGTQNRLLEERSNVLLNATKTFDHIVDVTGWHDKFLFDAEDLRSRVADIREMSNIEAVVQKELRVAQGIIKKKEAALRQLEELVEQGKEQEAVLNNVYNDIRVKERDCSEVEMQLVRLRKSVAKTDEALAVFDLHNQNASLAYMESDRDYLRDSVAEMKSTTRRQDNVIKAQLTRQQQLQTRLDVIMKSLREMKLDKKYERNIPKSALVPSASREEPEDVSKILPESECIPVPTYRLLHKNNEMLRVIVMRKNMLVLEKNAVIEALEAGLAKYGSALITTYKEQQDLRQNKDMELIELMDDLQQQHSNYLEKLEELRLQNAALKKKMYRSTRQHAPLKGTRPMR
ncbi:hypothetical protein DPX39_090067200 [Trypanosoma brucei equiperdum]|uniref:Uncharacterized protein n=1 Tax=Trypanosoma brucei equiperdum TaxID=630700 RepID=A0A3L6L0G7_9TRYP|nr:hypothetical protein DPX39_090067200 [Trypanosoma brucei equiperdum]